MRDKIVETFLSATTLDNRTSLTYTGKLTFQLKKGKEWASVSVDKPTWKKRAEHHLIVPDLWTAPDYAPHISAFTKKEVQSMTSDKIEELNGSDITFKFADSARIVDPDGWDEVYELAFEPVECFELEKIRMGLGFTPKMYFKHEFHMTLGLKLLKNKDKHDSRKI